MPFFKKKAHFSCVFRFLSYRRGHRHAKPSHLEITFALSCKQQSLGVKIQIMQAFLIFLHLNLAYLNNLACRNFGTPLKGFPPNLRSHPCANNKSLPLKIQIYSIFIIKNLHIPNICSNFAPAFSSEGARLTKFAREL